MRDNMNKVIVGLALVALAGLPAFAQDPSPDCDDDEIFVGGECKEIDDIVTGTRDGSSGGQSGLGGGTGSTSSGSSNNGYAGRPGGSSGSGSGSHDARGDGCPAGSYRTGNRRNPCTPLGPKPDCRCGEATIGYGDGWVCPPETVCTHVRPICQVAVNAATWFVPGSLAVRAGVSAANYFSDGDEELCPGPLDQ